jgi:hypothetical protein
LEFRIISEGSERNYTNAARRAQASCALSGQQVLALLLQQPGRLSAGDRGAFSVIQNRRQWPAHAWRATAPRGFLYRQSGAIYAPFSVQQQREERESLVWTSEQRRVPRVIHQ